MSDVTETQAQETTAAPEAPATEASIHDFGDEAAALAFLAEGREEPANTTQTRAPESAHAPEAPVAPAPAAAPDNDLKALLAKMARLEEQAAARDAELARLKAGDAGKMDLEEAKRDPVGVLKRLGYTPDAIAAFIAKGPQEQDPHEVSRNARFEQLEKIAKDFETFKAQQAQRDEQAARQQRIDHFKANLPSRISADKYPNLVASYAGDSKALADAIWEHMHDSLVYKKTDLSDAQAAAALEAQAARFAKAFKAPAPAKAAPKAAPAALTSSAPTQASTVKVDELDDAALEAAALAELARG